MSHHLDAGRCTASGARIFVRIYRNSEGKIEPLTYGIATVIEQLNPGESCRAVLDRDPNPKMQGVPLVLSAMLDDHWVAL